MGENKSGAMDIRTIKGDRFCFGDLSWKAISIPLERALRSASQLDYALFRSPARAAWRHRMIYNEAAATSSIEGRPTTANKLALNDLEDALVEEGSNERAGKTCVSKIKYALGTNASDISSDMIKQVQLSNGLDIVFDGGDYVLSENRSDMFDQLIHQWLSEEADYEGLPLLLDIGVRIARLHDLEPVWSGMGSTSRCLMISLFQHKNLTSFSGFFPSVGFALTKRVYAPSMGRLEAWLLEYLEAVRRSSQYGLDLLHLLEAAHLNGSKIIEEKTRQGNQARKVFPLFVTNPLLSRMDVCGLTGMAPNSAGRALDFLEAEGLIEDVTGRHNYRVFTLTGISSTELGAIAPLPKRIASAPPPPSEAPPIGVPSPAPLLNRLKESDVPDFSDIYADLDKIKARVDKRLQGLSDKSDNGSKH